MAGGGGGLAAPERVKRGKHSKRKKKKRVGFTLDMTPLVDITFLLLTFFMFTTTMAAPQTMEMSIPPEWKAQVEVRQSELLTIRVRGDAKIFWNIGSDDPQEIKLNKLKRVAEVENLKEKVRNRLITSLKISEDAPYGLIVNILDELNLAEVTITETLTQFKNDKGEPMKRSRKFTISTFDDSDTKLVGGL